MVRSIQCSVASDACVLAWQDGGRRPCRDMTGVGLVNGITDQTIQFAGKMERASGIRYPQ
jgi:hypothetical protein